MNPAVAVSVGESISPRDFRRAAPLKRVFDLALNAVLVIAVGVAVLCWRVPLFHPFLYAPNSTYHFGTVSAGQVVRTTFTVRNVHPWPVTVTDLKGSCGCTQAFPEKQTLPFRLAPLEAVSVVATLDTAAKKGAVEQTLHVVTSDSSNGTPLILSGTVTSPASK